MTLKLTLKPYERFIVNGCPMRNSGRRHTIVIEEMADVIREQDLLDQKSAVTPVSKVYFLVQTALTQRDHRDQLRPVIQELMAGLATVFGPPNVGHVFEAANYVSRGDYYKALRALKPVMTHENKLLAGLVLEPGLQANTNSQDCPA
jgi:flagellar biosynthesis repressor protein FlbT